MSDTSAIADPPRSVRHSTLFWKWFLAIAALSVAAVLTFAAFASRAYRSLVEERVDQRLQTAAITAADLLGDRWPDQPVDDVQRMAARLGEHLHVRLTLIALDGKVLADSSQKDLAAVQAAENHRNRREFVAARKTGVGSAGRVSTTLRERFRYQAVRVDRQGEPVGVVRAAVPISRVREEAAEVTSWLWTIAAGISAASMLGAFLLARKLAAPWQGLALAADQFAAGSYDQSLQTAARGSDEVGAVARALNVVSKRLAQREEQLHAASQTQAAVLEGMTECVIAVDRGERILLANASAGRVLGIYPERTPGMTLLEAMRSHELRELAQKALRSRQLAMAELTWRSKAQRVFHVLATPLPGDPPPGVVLVLRDVSELKQLERMRQQFIANVSHELKTPLSAIKAYAETLLGGALNDGEHAERFVGRIDEQAARLHQLIQDMLSLARIESGQAALELTSVPVARVVRRCLADMEPQADARQVSLENLVGDEGLAAQADEEGLRQILNNLIDNAVKYTPAGGRVTIRCRAENGTAVIDLADTGIGIAPEHHARLFERFYRVDKARSRELGGTGLGLAIVKHLCQAMRGSVSVQSELDKGSTFSVTLPLANS